MSDYSKVVNKGWFIVLVILVCLPTLWAYNPIPLYFLNDDFIHVPLSQEAVWGQRNSIRPFNDLTLYFDSLFWGKNAVGYHLTNLVIHLVNSVLVYFLSLQLLPLLTIKLNNKFCAIGIAILFWAYAFHSESVFWVIGRTGALATLFFLICFIIFLSGRRSWYHLLISFFIFFCGLLTYESVWILPPVLVLLTLFYKTYRTKRNYILIAGYWALFAYYFYLRIKWTGEVAGNYEGGNLKAFHAIALISNYAKLVARSFVGPQLNSTVFIVSAIAAFTTLFALIIAAIKRRQVTMSWLVFAVIALFSFVPYVSLGIDTHGFEAERYLYLPSVFVCVLLIALLATLKNTHLAFIAFAAYFCYQQYYLLKEAEAFKIASYISRNTIETIAADPQKDYYYFKNLPQENYGVPIFRLGLEEGVNWLTKDSAAAKKIRVVTFNGDENYRLSKAPAIKNLPFTTAENVAAFSTKTASKNGEYQLVPNAVSINPNRDLLIEYSDTTILVFKQ